MKTARDAKIIEKIREDILNASLDIILQEGFSSLTMRRLASGLNMTAPNIYNYFSNKDEIYIAIVIRGFELLKQELLLACDRNDDPVRRARDIMHTYLSFGMNNPRYYEVMLNRSVPHYRDYIGTPLETISERQYRIAMEIVGIAVNATTELMKTKQEQTSPDLIMTRMIHNWGLIHGIISLHNSGNMEYVIEDPVKQYTKVIDDLFEILFKI